MKRPFLCLLVLVLFSFSLDASASTKRPTKSDCKLAMETVKEFLEQARQGKTLQSDDSWMRLIYWKDKETGGDTANVSKNTRIEKCTLGKKNVIILISTEIVGSLMPTDNAFVFHPASPKKSAKQLRLFYHQGKWKIDAWDADTVPVGLSGALQRIQDESKNCGKAMKPEACEEEIKISLKQLERLVAEKR